MPLKDTLTIKAETQVLRRLSPLQKLKSAQVLHETARLLKAAGLRLIHPDWSEDKVQETVKKIFLHART